MHTHIVVIVCLLDRQRVKIPTGLKNPRWKDSAIEMVTDWRNIKRNGSKIFSAKQ